MRSGLFSKRWSAYLTASLSLLILGLALREAIAYYGRPIASMLVDPGAVVSGLAMPDWDTKRHGLKFPDRVIAVEGQSLESLPGAQRGRAFDRVVEKASAAGQQTLTVTVQTESAQKQFEVRLHPLEPLAWWIFAGSTFFAGALWVGAALIARWVSPSSQLARTFFNVARFNGLFLFTLFDFHTTRNLVPLFYLAYAMAPVYWVLLALRLPDDVQVLRRWPWLQHLAVGLGVLGAAFLIVPYLSGRAPQSQAIASLVLGAALLFFVATFVVRFVRSSGSHRETMRALLIAMVVPHAAIAGFLVLAPEGAWWSNIEIISFPALMLAPLATAYAFIRHDLWGSRAMLSRILTQALMGSVVCALAIAVGTAIAAGLGADFGEALIASTAGGIAAAILLTITLKLSDRAFFPSRAEYKPTVEQLSEELTLLSSPTEVARAIERTVARWLPCDFIRLELDVESMEQDDISGEHLVKRESPSELSLPVKFAGQHLGLLHFGSKRGGALFTSDDMDLLNTIANQGALALAHARAYQELERRRREQARAWRGEREALVETVAAEIAHEIRYPINYFRSVFERSGRGEALDEEDIDIGREEVDRLERLVAGLRRMAAHRLDRKTLRVTELCARAEILLRDALEGRQVTLDLDPDVQVRCDVDQVTQILVNLLSNALQATEREGSVGVRWQRTPRGGEISVWDTGPGFVGDPARLFAPWYTTKPRGTGLGLAITHRLVRAHGWNVTASRDAGRTQFCISIRAEDIVNPEAPDETLEQDIA